MEKYKLKIISEKVRERAVSILYRVPLSPVYEIIIRPADKRTLEQNAKLWPLLTDISEQIVWHGYRLSKEEWKDFFTAALRGQKIVPNMDGSGFITVGGKTSIMSKREFSDLIEIILCFGAENNVKWRATVDEEDT